MYKVIAIGQEKIPILSKASTNMYYKSVFHEDPITVQSKDDVENAERI